MELPTAGFVMIQTEKNNRLSVFVVPSSLDWLRSEGVLMLVIVNRICSSNQFESLFYAVFMGQCGQKLNSEVVSLTYMYMYFCIDCNMYMLILRFTEFKNEYTKRS